MISIVGEFLTFSDPQLKVKPWLATSWKPNKTSTVWTFQIRKGVKFHNGKTMTADDVVASFKQYLTGTTSAAASVFKAILSPRASSRQARTRSSSASSSRTARSRTSSARRPTRRPSSRPELRARHVRG